MQIYQGNFVADIEPIKNTRTPQIRYFRIRISQLRPGVVDQRLHRDRCECGASASGGEASRGSGL
jgi:hypothetical protein